MTIRVQIEGLKEFRAALEKSPQVAAAEFDKAIKRTILTLLGDARKKAPVDRGFLRGAGMVTSFSPLKGKLENTAPYAKFVHDGTKPHFPPLHAIEPWARRHGIPPFLVARSIAKKGTKAIPFFQEAVDENEKNINNIFEKAVKNIVDQIAK